MSGPNRYTEGLLEHADVVGSTLAANGEIRVNLGDSATGSGIDRSVPFWGTDGFLSRPADPDANGAAQFVFFVDGNQRFAIGSRDRRSLMEAGTLDPGDRVVYTPSGVRIFADNSEGTIELRTPGGSVMLLSDTEFSVTLVSGAKFELTDTNIEASLPTVIPTGLFVDSSSCVLSAKNLGQTIHMDAFATVTLGLTGGTIRPFIPTVENVNIGPGGGITIPSPRVFAASA
jgi:hypothetical protein